MKLNAVALFTCLTLTSAVAWAGTVVWGYGDTRSSAASDAEDKARDLARQKKTCYERVRPEQCKEDKGGWMCSADVANHSGSCGRDDKVNP